jgi:hypothetical protein
MLLIPSSDAKRVATMQETIELEDGTITTRKKQVSITPKT